MGERCIPIVSRDGVSLDVPLPIFRMWKALESLLKGAQLPTCSH